MFGNNPKRSPEAGTGENLKLVEIFPTLQGEGPHAGRPAVFIRLGGCNLACRFCDTEFENFRETPLHAILAGAAAQSGKASLAVITGGEPFRQPIAPLCEGLLAQGFTVQIETNGTLYRPIPEAVEIVCSPKNESGQGYRPIRPDLAERVNAYKFLISAHLPEYHDVPPLGGDTPIYLQPMDEYDPQRNAANLARTVELARSRGYHVSLQLHKLMNLP